MQIVCICIKAADISNKKSCQCVLSFCACVDSIVHLYLHLESCPRACNGLRTIVKREKRYNKLPTNHHYNKIRMYEYICCKELTFLLISNILFFLLFYKSKFFWKSQLFSLSITFFQFKRNLAYNQNKIVILLWVHLLLPLGISPDMVNNTQSKLGVK